MQTDSNLFILSWTDKTTANFLFYFHNFTKDPIYICTRIGNIFLNFEETIDSDVGVASKLVRPRKEVRLSLAKLKDSSNMVVNSC